MTEIAARKADARKAAFARRKAAHSQHAGLQGCTRLVELLESYRSGTITGYMPIRTEIDILPAMKTLSQTATIGVPVILGAGRPLVFHQWTPDTPMTDGPFGAQVPANGALVVPDVVILPLLSFDRRGYRLGYGGGFYDRTLEKLNAKGHVLAVGFAYADQEVETVPIEPTDQRMDAVVTEKETIWFS